MRLGEILLKSGILDERQLGQSLDYAFNKLIPLGRVVKLLKHASEEDLESCIIAQKAIRSGAPVDVVIGTLQSIRGSKALFEKALQERLAKQASEAAQPVPKLELEEKKKEPPLKTSELQVVSVEDLLRKGDQSFDKEQFADAEKSFKFALQRLEKSDGPNNDSLTPALRRLASLYMATERFPEAHEHYARILQIKQSTFGDKDISVASAYEDMGDLNNVLRNFRQAQNLYLLASSIFEKNLPSSLAGMLNCVRKLLACSLELEPVHEHKRIGAILTEAGVVTDEQLQKLLKLAKQENIPLGAVLRRECIIDEKGLQSFLSVQALMADGTLSCEAAARAYKAAVLSGIPLIKLLHDAGFLEGAEENKRVRLELISALSDLIDAELGLGPHHLEVALRGYDVGNLHYELGHLLPAESYYRRAYAICNRDRKANTFLHASISKQLGIILARSERTLQAEPFFMEALELMQVGNQAESKDALDVLQELSLLQSSEKNYAMAWQFFLSAFALASKKEMLDVLTAPFYDSFNKCAIEMQQEPLAETLYLQALSALSGGLSERAETLAKTKLGELQKQTNH